MKLRTTAALAALLIALSAFASPAAAETVTALSCNGTHTYGDTKYKWAMPVHRSADGKVDPLCVMGRNASGPHVTVLQRTLHDCYGQAIAVDGYYGPATERALANAQRFHGIDPDGVYGPVTAKTIAHNSSPDGKFFPQC